MSTECQICQHPTHRKKLSKAAYRIHLLGMFTNAMRSFLFNAFVFFLGTSLGMGFTIIHVQKVWKEKYANDTVTKLERALNKYGANNKEIESLLIELRDKRIGTVDKKKEKAAK